MNNNFKRQFIFVMFMLLGCFYAKADDDLITQQITINVSEAGTLKQKISDADKYRITKLKLTGKLNVSDIQFVREMANCMYYKEGLGAFLTDGHLEYLNLSDVKFVGNAEFVIWYRDGMYSSREKAYFCEDKIGDRCFSRLWSLKHIVLPDSMTSIGAAAFARCSSLVSVKIPNSVTSIGSEAFFDCSSLASVKIPNSVTSIGSEAFLKCSSLASVNIPDGVTNINSSAFARCTNLVSVNIPYGVTIIENDAFDGCHSLVSVEIPNSVTRIGAAAFRNCSSFTSVAIPSSVTSIEQEAFSGCSNLTSVYSYATDSPASIYGKYYPYSAFDDITFKNCILYVPKGLYQKYKSTGWNKFEHILEFDATGIELTKKQTVVTETSRYTLDGKRLNAPTNGVNIVKYSDGTVRKVLEK